MGYLGNVVHGIAEIMRYVIQIYNWIIIGGVVISWINADPYNPIVRVIRNLTEPVFRFVRRHLPFVMVGGLDLSPVVVLLSLWFANYAVVENLLLFARTH